MNAATPLGSRGRSVISSAAPHDYAAAYAQSRRDSLTRDSNPLYASASGGGDALYSTASSTGAGKDVSEGLYDLAANKKTEPSAKTTATKKGKGGGKAKRDSTLANDAEIFIDGSAGESMYAMANGNHAGESMYDMANGNHAGESMYDMANGNHAGDGSAGESMYDMANGKASNTPVYDMGTNNHAGEALYAEASNQDGYLNVGPEDENVTSDSAGNGGGDAMYNTAGNGSDDAMYDTAGNGGGEAMYDTAGNGGGEAMYDTAGNGGGEAMHDVAGSTQAEDVEVVDGFGEAEEDDEK